MELCEVRGNIRLAKGINHMLWLFKEDRKARYEEEDERFKED
jgi:hypothetical protein